MIFVIQVVFLIAQVYPVAAQSSNNEAILQSKPDMQERVEFASNKAQAQVMDFMSRDWTIIDCSSPHANDLSINNQPAKISDSQPISKETNISDVNEPIVQFEKYPSIDINQPELSASGASSSNIMSSEDILASNPSYYPYTETYSFPAPIMSPTKDGNWFPKQSYSVLAFEYNNPLLCCVNFWIDIQRDQDVYSRYLTIYQDGGLILQVVIGSGGYHGAVDLGWSLQGNHKIEVQINYCGWKDHQWKLTYAQPFIAHWTGEKEPIYDFWEYFPSGYYPTLEWQVQAGFDSYIHLETNVISGSAHYIYIYINGVYRALVRSGGASALILQSYPDDSVVTVKLKLSTSAEEYYGTKIKYFTISHNVVTLEIDWMGLSDGTPLVPFADLFTMTEYVRSYYILHGYARLDCIVDNWILKDAHTTPDDYKYYRSINYAHAGNSKFEWVLIAEYGGGYYSETYGWHWKDATADWGIAIFASQCGTLNYMRMVLLHEFGHHAGIIEYDNVGEEKYCSNFGCCMSYATGSNAVAAPWYCIKHWSLREYPFTPQG